MLEFGSEVALEIVFDDEDAEKIGIAAGASDVPGKSGQAKGRDGRRMKEAEGVAPALGEERPEKDSACGENDRGGGLGAGPQGQEKNGEKGTAPRGPRRVSVMFA